MATNQNSSMMFATLFIAAINKTSGNMHFICAGHESPFLVSLAGEKLLDSISGPAIGLFPGVPYTVYDAQLQPGDTLVVYSDGLIDLRNPDDISWGIGRLRALLSTTRVVSSSQILSTIVEHAENHMSSADQFDDLTVMAFRWLGSKT
jgi:sigma-B regulation protein RsbU (phosphoserine phosphatase)